VLRRLPAGSLAPSPARTPAELPPSRSRKNDTICQRPVCGQRQLGQQRCDDCGIFTRRIGPGCPCPHYDELVAITDIQDLTQ
jgi:hypothetical protein